MAIRKEEEKNGMSIVDNMNGEKRANDKLNSMVAKLTKTQKAALRKKQKIADATDEPIKAEELVKGGKICIEVRSLNDSALISNSTYDKEDLSYKTTHKRWLYSIDKLEKLLTKYNMKKIYMEEGYFSPNTNTETQNPLLIRCIIEKK